MTIASNGLSEDYPLQAIRQSPQASGRLVSIQTPEQNVMSPTAARRWKHVRDNLIMGFLYTASGAFAVAAVYQFLAVSRH